MFRLRQGAFRSIRKKGFNHNCVNVDSTRKFEKQHDSQQDSVSNESVMVPLARPLNKTTIYFPSAKPFGKTDNYMVPIGKVFNLERAATT